MKVVVAVISVLLFTGKTVVGQSAVNAREVTPDVPIANDWQQTCVQQQFCFSHPASMQVQDVQPIDSIAGELANKEVRLAYDLGAYATEFNDIAKAEGTIANSVSIGGRAGKLYRSASSIALSVPHVANGVKLSLIISLHSGCDSQGVLDKYRKIIDTIKFLNN